MDAETEGRFDRLEGRFDRLEGRFDRFETSVNQRFDVMIIALDGIITRLDTLTEAVAAIGRDLRSHRHGGAAIFPGQGPPAPPQPSV